MQTKRLLFCIAALLVASIFSDSCTEITPYCSSQIATNDNYLCQSGTFVFQVVQSYGLPLFSFFTTTSLNGYNYNGTPVSGSVYLLQFTELVELSDGKATHRVSLTDLDWIYGEPSVEDVSSNGNCRDLETRFTLSCENSSAFESLSFVNHLDMSDDDVSSIKFDVILRGYQWQDSRSDSLQLTFDYSSWGGYNATRVNATTYTLEDSYVQITRTASNNVRVSLADSSEDDPTVGFIYERFQGDLVHDPIIGIDKSKTLPIPPDLISEEEGSGGSYASIFTPSVLLIVTLAFFLV